jgi:signal transduction histidine kinase
VRSGPPAAVRTVGVEMAITSNDTLVVHAIERAAARVVGTYPAGSRAEDEEILRQEVDALVTALERALDDEGGTAALGTGAMDRLRLLRMVRTELLGAWEGDDSSLLRTMRAFEEVQRSLVDRMQEETVREVLNPFSRSLLREVAHLLRSPLGSIVMMADMLREADGVTDAERRQIDIIHRSALSIATSAGDLLALVGDDERFGEVDRFSVGEILEIVHDIVAPVAEARGRILEIEREVEGFRSGPEPALTEMLLGLTLRATLRGKGGRVLLSARSVDEDTVGFSILSRADDPPPGGADPLMRVFRLDPDSRSYTLSDDGLTVAAARTTLDRLGGELRLEAPEPTQVDISFELDLPRAEG